MLLPAAKMRHAKRETPRIPGAGKAPIVLMSDAVLPHVYWLREASASILLQRSSLSWRGVPSDPSIRRRDAAPAGRVKSSRAASVRRVFPQGTGFPGRIQSPGPAGRPLRRFHRSMAKPSPIPTTARPEEDEAPHNPKSRRACKS